MVVFEDKDVMADEAAVTSPTTTTSIDNILAVCSYDVSITYDKYHQTPRVWLTGYTNDRTSTPLMGDEMMQNVILDYSHRTVTVKEYFHVRGVYASGHQCQHGALMRTIVTNLMRDGEGEGTIFLKFVSSMILIITYDFTMDVSALTKK